MKKIIFVFLFIFLFSQSYSFAQNVVIIANESVKESVLSKHDIRSIFLCKKKNLVNGKIKIAVQKDLSHQKMFLREYVDKSPSQYNIYYKKLIFTGKGSAPNIVTDNKEMILYISNTPGAIGYVINDANLPSSVKVIRIQG